MNNRIKHLLNKYQESKEAKNASWLVAGKIVQMLLSLIVSVLTARFLGPSNYGSISYGTAYVAFFTSLCSLGINSIIVKNFVDHPNEEGETIGTAVLLKFLSSSLGCFLIFLVTSVIDAGETETILVVFLCSLSLIFHVFDTLNYWFQSRYQSKKCAMATVIAYIVTSIYKLVLLVLQKEVMWFAFATSVDYIVYAIMIVAFYKKAGGPKFSVSFQKAKQLLGTSYHFILSGLMVAVYGYTDRIMLKQMLDSTAVGYYSMATTVCAMWTFVLQAIIDSMYPTIMLKYKIDKSAFQRVNKQLYCIVFYVSVVVSLVFSVFAELIIKILYGADYMGAISPLRIITWYTAFSYLGVARNAWIVCENKQKYLKYMYASATVINVALNFVLIPKFSTSGAAVASLITQICTSIILPFLFKEMRPNSILILSAISPHNIFCSFKSLIRREK